MAVNEESFNEAVDSIPERRDFTAHLAPLQTSSSKASQRVFDRRESLLTRQLQSENEMTDEDPIEERPRALSTQSTYSMASTAELTSDDGQSVPSPVMSPPLPPTLVSSDLTAITKLSPHEPKIVRSDERPIHKPLEPISKQSVEANLGRKRCISFACGGKTTQPSKAHSQEQQNRPQPQPQPQPQPTSHAPQPPASPPKRKCSLKFVCPTRTSSAATVTERPKTSGRRVASPPPPPRRTNSSLRSPAKVHRDSDSTLRHASPNATRKSPSIVTTAATPTPPRMSRKFSDELDRSGEATRFHVFGSSEDEPEDWCQESTAYRSRLTMSDVLKKENILRKACEEVEEEAVAEDEDEEAQLDDDDLAGDDNLEDDEEEDDEDRGDESESDDGFDTDDEGGFADSDSEGEDSDADWWTPGGLSTAATSIEHMERLFSQIPAADLIDASSVGSGASSHVAPEQPRQPRRRRHPKSMAIPRDLDASDLPDSTDFVCGTLDEDRPVEQAFLESMKQREAAKHVTRPQDIDPSFPTSDPEMDEDDDDDLVESKDSPDGLMHGRLEEHDFDAAQRRRISPRPGARAAQRSRSPAPPKLNAKTRSPAPPTRRNTRSPPPPVSRARSPAPTKIRITSRSPPPPTRRGTARSPPPRKMMSQSPKRARSPAPVSMLSSAVGTAAASPTSRTSSISFAMPGAFGSLLPHLSQVASSLPRGGEFVLSRLNSFNISEDEDEAEAASAETGNKDLPKRGAIDIVKGLEKKRQRRREKMLQKAAAKAATKGEKAYKVKPGKGAERMREVGLELQRYRGKGEHIISM